MSESTELYLFTLAGSGMPKERVEGIRLLIQGIEENDPISIPDIDSILNCTFEDVYFWEKYVPPLLREQWTKLPVEARLSLFYVAGLIEDNYDAVDEIDLSE